MDSATRIGEEASLNEQPPSELNQQLPSNEANASPKTGEESLDTTPGLAEDLRTCDWDQLLERYASAMEEHSQADAEVRNQTGKLYEVLTQLPITVEITSDDSYRLS